MEAHRLDAGNAASTGPEVLAEPAPPVTKQASAVALTAAKSSEALL